MRSKVQAKMWKNRKTRVKTKSRHKQIFHNYYVPSVE